MAGLDFKEPEKREQEDAAVVAFNTRMGVILFVVYVIFYGGFMGVSAFRPDIMAQPILGGVNLAVVSGFALIALAIILALVYLKACRKPASGGSK